MALSYAQRRFLHQNPSFIHNIQSDQRAAMGAARGAAIEAEAVRSGGGYYRGNAWISPGAADEQAAVDQQAEAAQQVNHLRDELERQGQIVQSGSYVFSPEEIRQRQEVSQQSLAALDSLSPFVQSGLVDADTIRKAVGQVATDSFNDQRNKRRMEAELKELWQAAHRAGGFTAEQSQGVLKQMVDEYGVENLGNSTLGAKILGIDKQIQEEQTKQRLNYAQRLGVDTDAVVWDSRNNRAVLDESYVNDAQQVAEVKRIPAELEIARRKVAASIMPLSRPDRRNYNAQMLGGEAAADKAYRNDLKQFSKDMLFQMRFTHGPDSPEVKEAERYAAELGVVPTGGVGSAPAIAGDLIESTPQDLQLVQRMVNAGLKEPGPYIGLDGVKKQVTRD